MACKEKVRDIALNETVALVYISGLAKTFKGQFMDNLFNVKESFDC